MGLHVKQNKTRSQFQEQLDADLRAKIQAQKDMDLDTPDGVNESAYIEGTTQSSSAWLWVILAIAVVILLGVFIVIMNGAGV